MITDIITHTSKSSIDHPDPEVQDHGSLKDILRYNKNHSWEVVGQMKVARADHTVRGCLTVLSVILPETLCCV